VEKVGHVYDVRIDENLNYIEFKLKMNKLEMQL